MLTSFYNIPVNIPGCFYNSITVVDNLEIRLIFEKT
jgi:hypothetical protein